MSKYNVFGKEGIIMDKEKIKKGLQISLIIGVGLAIAITYFFLIYSNVSIGNAINSLIVVLRPFIVGAVIAYILKSTCNFYEKYLLKGMLKSKKANEKKAKKTANILAVVFTYITWLIIFTLILWIAIPSIIKSVTNFVTDIVENLPIYIETAQSWIDDIRANNPNLGPVFDQAYTAIINWLQNDLAPMIPDLGQLLLIGIFDFINVLKDIAIGLVISVFFLSGRKVFAKKTSLLVHCIFKEKHAKAIISETKFADKMFSGFLEGKIIDSTIIGIIYYIALVLMGVEYPALLALICGITNIIPFFGPFIGAVPSGLIILMSNENPLPKLLYFIIFVCVIQFIDGNIIDPHIVGGNIKISPFCVIFSVIVFGGLWGFIGLLIGVPVFAVIYDIVKKLIYHRLKKAGKAHLVDEFLGDIKKRPKKAVQSDPQAPIKEMSAVEDQPEPIEVEADLVEDEPTEDEPTEYEPTEVQAEAETEENN